MKFLIRFFIREHQNTEDAAVREKYSILSGITGILCNIVLFIVKLLSGMYMGSMAIFADAFNNLSDCGSSVISIAGARLSNRQPDKEHPFGHGRMEYISSLIVSFLIILVGLELLKSAAGKVVHPEPVSASPLLLCILILTVFVKIWMFCYNRYMGNQIHSTVLKATAQDSLNDSIATSATIIAAFVGQFTALPVDGIMGVLVSLFIMYGGFNLAKDTIGVLLGSPADKATIQKISDILLSQEEILGMHDLIVHDYGPGRVMASVHAEVSDKGNIVAIHETIDALETKVMHEMGIHLVIHMDPITTDSEITNTVKVYIQEYLDKHNPNLSFHDLRITDGEQNVNIIFDLVVPADYTLKMREKEIAALKAHIKALSEKYSVVINVDTAF